MAKSTPERDSIKKRTIKYMQELGTYKTQYNQVLEKVVEKNRRFWQALRLSEGISGRIPTDSC